jgi:hypothetical protein
MITPRREYLRDRNEQAIREVEQRQAKMDKLTAGKPLLERLAPGGSVFNTLDSTLGTFNRSRIVDKLNAGGTPVLDPQGRTIGAVYRTRLGNQEYVGRSEYNPIAARVETMTGSGDAFEDMEYRDGAYSPVRVATTPVRAESGGLVKVAGGYLQRRVDPVDDTSQEDEPAPAAAPAVEEQPEQLVTASASGFGRTTKAARGVGRRRAFGTRRSLINYRNV